MYSSTGDAPLCPKCKVRSGFRQCVNCGRDYDLKEKREAALAAKKEAERIAALIPLFLNGGTDVSYRKSNGAPISLIKIDYDMTGNKNWKALFQRIRSFELEGYKGAKEVIKQIKKQRYWERTRVKHWSEFVSRDIQIWAHTVINIEVSDPNVSNVRCAKMSDRAATRRYFKQKHDGCCGSFDTIKRCPFDWFRKYRIGCNYGH